MSRDSIKTYSIKKDRGIYMKKYIMALCIGVLLVGCSTPKEETVTTTVQIEDTTPTVEQPKENLIDISEIDNTDMDISGTVTNNNKMQVRFIMEVFYLDADSKQVASTNVYIDKLKVGEVRNWTDSVDVDISKATYKTQLKSFTVSE